MTGQNKPTIQESISDPATSYACSVVSGETVAGPHVRDACRRHLSDLKTGHNRGLVWSVEHVEWVIGYFRDVLCLNGGEYEGLPFELLGWQAFTLGCLFGWFGDDGYRRFRVAYVETGKGSGKSPLAAGIGLFGLTADQESRAEVYAAATKKDQAMILFRDAVAMVDQSPELKCRVHKSGALGKEWNLAYHETGSFFRPISADDGQSGPRPHIGLLDEIHEHRNSAVIEMMRAGTKSRRQALIFMITNSGAGKHTVCWDYHDYAVKVAAAQIEDDSFFSFVCALDKDDDPLQDESCWEKANPSLAAGIPGYKYLREQVTQARGMPSKESIVRRLGFCQWVEAISPFIGADVWFGCEDKDFDPDKLIGRTCYGGLDLSSTQDLTAFILLFEPVEADPYWRLLPRFWLPGDRLADKEHLDRVPYTAWRDAGYLQVLPGRAINKLAVLRDIAEAVAVYNLKAVAYDRWRIEDLNMLMEQEGLSLPLEAFGQGFKDMSPALDEFERRLLNKTIRHDGNPVMTWCAANAVAVSDPAENRKIDKKKATGRVDGIVGSIMATGQSIRTAEAEPTPELIIL